MVWARNTGHVVGMWWAWHLSLPPRTEGTHGLSHCREASQAKTMGDTDLLGEQPSMLILHCPILGKHIIKFLNDFRDT